MTPQSNDELVRENAQLRARLQALEASLKRGDQGLGGKQDDEAARRYELLASHTRDIILFVNRNDGRILEANSAALSTYGYTREEMGRLSIHDLRASETRETTELQMHIADESGLQFETIHRKKDGSTFPVEVSSRGAEIGTSRILISVVRDISERKQAEAALRQTTERFALLSETAETLLASRNPQAQVEALCRKVMRHLGCNLFFNYLADDLSGRLRLNACAGIPEAEARKIEWLDYGTAVCGCVARDNKRIIAENIQESADARTQLVKGFGVQAYCCHPLVVGERLIGTLSFGTRSKVHFDANDLELMRAVTNQVAVAMQRITAENAVKTSEQRYRLLFDKNPDGVFSVDPTGRFIMANRACETISGYPKEELMQTNFMELCAPEQMARTAEHIGRTLRAHRYSELETALIRKDGSRVDLWIASEPVEQDGSLVIHCTAKDITGRKRAETVLRESKQRLDLALKTGLSGTFDWDITTNDSLWSDELLALYGLKPSEFHGHYDDWIRCLIPEDRAAGIEAVRRALETGEFALEFRIRRRDNGEVRWMHGRGQVLCDEIGQPVRLVGINVDITDRKRVEESLRESEARFRLAKEAAKLGIFDYRPVTRSITWDARMRELWGIGPDTPITMELWMSGFPAQDRLNAEAAAKRALDPAGDGSFIIEHRVVNARDGTIRWIVATGQATFEGGQAVRLVGTVQDITERKEFQAELERLVEERTAKLQELVAELEHFSYTITHDMRAPLRAMKGYADLTLKLVAEAPENRATEFLRRIAVSAERMDTLITDALNYNRAVRQELALSPVDLHALLRGMLDSYPEFQSSHIQLCLEGIPHILGNEAGLTQCFSNLLGNAVKFVAPGDQPNVRVWAEMVKPGADAASEDKSAPRWVRIWVQDRGIGISPEMIPKVFDMFSRGHRSYEGTGIGLALVRKVVDRMGGRVGVESVLGRGSRFWIELQSAN